MNERIDKLLVKAGAYFGGEGVDYSNFDPKKFAELIVRECVDKAERYGLGSDAVEQMKEDFGVGK
jgi:hypothetical protein